MLRRLRELLSDSAFYGASSLIERVVGFLLLPLYTQYLGTEDYGIIAMLAILTTVFAPLARLGITNAIFRRFSLVEDNVELRRVLSTGLLSVLGSAFVLCGVGLLAAGPLTHVLLGQRGYVHLVQLSLLTAALATIGEVPMVALRAERRVRTIALLNIARLIVTVAMTIWLVVVREEGVLGFVVALLVSAMVFNAVAFWLTHQAFRPIFDRGTWKSMVAYGLPFVPHHIQAVGLAYFGQYVVAEMLNLEEAGLYNIALRFTLPLAFVVGSLQKAWVPYKFEVHAQDDRSQDFFRSAVTYYSAAISYLLVGVAAWAPEVARLMTAPEFHKAATYVPVLALVPVAQGLYFMLGTGIELTDDTRPLPLVSLAGLVVVVVFSLLAVPQLGAIGAAAATAAGWLVMAIVIYHISQRRFRIEYDFGLIIVFLGLAVAATLGAVIVQEQNFSQRLAYALGVSLIYPVIIIALLLRSKTERARVVALWTRFPFLHSLA
ncbi:MAG TPA: lipopolysaccharide biosynthesis protein [Rhodothermales bacterium]|nr:lipopolysaccharide biosynthesis protein [Rhodothermales bacterium]